MASAVCCLALLIAQGKQISCVSSKGKNADRVNAPLESKAGSNGEGGARQRERERGQAFAAQLDYGLSATVKSTDASWELSDTVQAVSVYFATGGGGDS